MGSNIQSALPGDEAMPEEGSGGGANSSMLQAALGIAIVVGALGIYLLIKRRKKK
jgi:LPXTG-motif cell wall-anchored protein